MPRRVFLCSSVDLSLGLRRKLVLHRSDDRSTGAPARELLVLPANAGDATTTIRKMR
jgi:hypothetical protein